MLRVQNYFRLPLLSGFSLITDTPGPITHAIESRILPLVQQEMRQVDLRIRVEPLADAICICLARNSPVLVNSRPGSKYAHVIVAQGRLDIAFLQAGAERLFARIYGPDPAAVIDSLIERAAKLEWSHVRDILSNKYTVTEEILTGAAPKSAHIQNSPSSRQAHDAVSAVGSPQVQNASSPPDNDRDQPNVSHLHQEDIRSDGPLPRLNASQSSQEDMRPEGGDVRIDSSQSNQESKALEGEATRIVSSQSYQEDGSSDVRPNRYLLVAIACGLQLGMLAVLITQNVLILSALRHIDTEVSATSIQAQPKASDASKAPLIQQAAPSIPLSMSAQGSDEQKAAERKEQEETERKGQEEAERKKKEEAERKKKKEAERKKKEEAERKKKEEAERKKKQEDAEKKKQEETEKKKQEEAEKRQEGQTEEKK